MITVMAGHFENHFRKRARGASLVEYALLLVAVLLLAAGGFKLLGGSVAKRSAAASDTVTATGGPGGPDGPGRASAAGPRGHTAPGAASLGKHEGDVAEGFAGKKWFAVGLLATGIGALGYVVLAMRKAKADAHS